MALYINGGRLLEGKVEVSGSKNGSLALMAAALLASGESQLHDVPDVNDVHNLRLLFGHLGAKTSYIGNTLSMKTDNLQSTDICPETSRLIRASILLLGPILARFGHARIPLPGGCAIGERPIDQHLLGLKGLGATININVQTGIVEARSPPGGLRGGKISFNCPTVTGTMNLMLAATLATGTTTIQDAAQEPEVADLAACLRSMGCIIKGAGTPTITIHGRKRLKPYLYTVLKDRIESGTLLIAGALSGNPLTVQGCYHEHHEVLINSLRQAGADIKVQNQSTIKVYRANPLRAVNIETGPYPAFPTDLQPQFMTLMSIANGTSIITENIFETRFGQVPSLINMGAKIILDDKQAIIHGVSRLAGSQVASTDLRCAASLLLAALVARGTTSIESTAHLDRGYDGLEQKLIDVGAFIIRHDKDGSEGSTP